MSAHTPTKDLIPTLQRSATTAFGPLQRELNRFFEELGEGWSTFTEFRSPPRMDVVDTEKGLEVTVEVPGLTREQVKITAEDDLLTISGEKKAEHEEKANNYRLLERSYGQFSRSIYLPRSLDAGKISATMEHGVLKVVVPKRVDAQTKTIEIQAK